MSPKTDGSDCGYTYLILCMSVEGVYAWNYSHCEKITIQYYKMCIHSWIVKQNLKSNWIDSCNLPIFWKAISPDNYNHY